MIKKNEVLSKFKGLYVEVRQSKNKEEQITNLEFALKKMKRMIKRTNLMLQINEMSHYTKPSAKRRSERNRAKVRARSSEQQKN